MGREMKKMILMILILGAFFLIPLMGVDVEALEPKLLWKKEFKAEINSLDLATESGHVILSVNGRQVFLFDKDSNERFRWGPRIDRGGGGVSISKDGKYFAFETGYTEEYAFKKDVHWSADDRVHFYNGQTKKELWDIRDDGTPSIFPDGLSVVIGGYTGGSFSIYDAEGRKKFSFGQPLGIPSFAISPDSAYFAFVKDSMQPLVLCRRNGAKVWEKGRHDSVASISEGASYISTYPYLLTSSYSPDAQNSHEGIVYDKNGNIFMKGFGVVSGDGSKIALLYSEKVAILTLPDKRILREIPISMKNIFLVSQTSNLKFSQNGKYIIIKTDTEMKVYDLIQGINKTIPIQNLGKYPWFLVSRDGKYLLIRPHGPVGEKSMHYFQLY